MGLNWITFSDKAAGATYSGTGTRSVSVNVAANTGRSAKIGYVHARIGMDTETGTIKSTCTITQVAGTECITLLQEEKSDSVEANITSYDYSFQSNAGTLYFGHHQSADPSPNSLGFYADDDSCDLKINSIQLVYIKDGVVLGSTPITEPFALETPASILISKFLPEELATLGESELYTMILRLNFDSNEEPTAVNFELRCKKITDTGVSSCPVCLTLTQEANGSTVLLGSQGLTDVANTGGIGSITVTASNNTSYTLASSSSNSN